MDFLFSESLVSFGMLIQPQTLLYLLFGVVVGMALGIVPGFSGVTGVVLLLPLVLYVEMAPALALLLGIYVSANVTDTIPSVLLGVPGTASAQAHVLDGYPLAKLGQADRALAASYVADLVGVVFGVAMFFLLLPALVWISLQFGAPEYFMLGIIGISMIGLISSGSGKWQRGLVVGCFGLLLSTVGLSPLTGLPRNTFTLQYLWDGIPIVPLVLGLFGLPEITHLFAKNSTIAADEGSITKRGGTWLGIRDGFSNIPMLLGASLIGTVIGLIPALGGSVSQWVAYAFARQTAKDPEGFGHGDVRGVMAPQAAVAADKPGGLIPTLVFGVPGNVLMAIVMGAFVVLGIRPGPEMLSTDLHLTIFMMFLLLAGTLIALALSLSMGRLFLRITHISPALLAPILLAFMMLGSLVATGTFSDIVTFLCFGIVGTLMDKGGWPRVPIILGFVLGEILETYLSIALDAYGYGFVFRPLVLTMVVAILLGLILSWKGPRLFVRRLKKVE